MKIQEAIDRLRNAADDELRHRIYAGEDDETMGNGQLGRAQDALRSARTITDIMRIVQTSITGTAHLNNLPYFIMSALVDGFSDIDPEYANLLTEDEDQLGG